MLIVGDIACPSSALAKELHSSLKNNGHIFNGKSLLANLEGLITDELSTKTNTPILFNHSTVLEVLSNYNCIALGLANNHTLDIPQNFNGTLQYLKKYDIAHCGAGITKDDAEKPVIIQTDGKRIAIFNACWDFLLYHQKNPANGVYVSTINEQKLLNTVSEHKRLFPDHITIIFFHWSFDLETLPFPMYRTFSKALIDAGAKIVIGCHSHCIQGGEIYNSGYIVYGLGNFFIPDGIFANGKLSFPGFSRNELIFEYDFNNDNAICHWFKYEHEYAHKLIHISSEVFENSEILKSYSLYQNMSDDIYLNYYKKNRRKNKLIPVFVHHKKRYINSLYTHYLKQRARLARLLAKSGFIKWQN